jgi:dihydroorotate dehydrogenase (NAD+) catalytic subunit
VRKKKAVVTGRAAAARAPKARPSSGASRKVGATRSLPVATTVASTAASNASSSAGAGVSLAVNVAALEPVEVDLSIDLAPTRPGALLLRNPVLVASGTFGYGVEYGEIVDIEQLGAICCKGTTLKARAGNPPPRVTETPAGMLNSIGLQNPGVDAVLERYAARWASWSVPVIVNVAGESVGDYVAVARKLDSQPGVAGIELNISCPNVGRGGLQFALDAGAAGEVTAAVRRATDLPLLVKLSPAATDVRGIARAVEEAGADAICAVNTLSGMAIDRTARRPLLGNTYGGLSGPALKPVALRVVFEVAQVVRIPIVAIGGVGSLEDVLDFLMAGACAVQVGTAVFADPLLPARLVDELATWCAAHGITSHRELVGVAVPQRRDRSSLKGVEYRP